MRYVPHEYQLTAYNWIMDHPRCGLFLDMGLGKTVVTLTAVKELIDCMEVEKVLVIAPLRVAQDTWSREIEQWDHLQGLRLSTVTGSQEQRKKALMADADIYVINRENVVWLVKHFNWDFDMLVIDELSSFKSSAAQRFKALKKNAAKCSRVVGLTGTPAPNGYMNLWSELYLLDMGERLGRTITDYRRRYFFDRSHNPQYQQYELINGMREVINGKIDDICLSMEAIDYLAMPERIDNVLHVKMDRSEEEAYRRMERDQLLTIGDTDISTYSAAGLMNKLLQLANGFMYDEEGAEHRIHERKLDALEEIADCNPGEPVLVFYSYRADKDAILARFKDARVLNTSQDIADWNEGKAPMMIAHPASIGHGLNIQKGGHIIVWYGLPWSLELYQQANGRLYRQGQKNGTVIINHLVNDGTADEQVLNALKSKSVTQAALMDALKERQKRIK